MREILFRGKTVNTNRWIYGYYSLNFGDSSPQIREKTDCCCIDVIPETVGQYTGLTDKNGKRIFEGDIVTMPAYLGGRHKAVVYFKNGKFAVDGSHYYFKDIAPKNMEVIGNIHDNPELLKGSDS